MRISKSIITCGSSERKTCLPRVLRVRAASRGLSHPLGCKLERDHYHPRWPFARWYRALCAPSPPDLFRHAARYCRYSAGSRRLRGAMMPNAIVPDGATQPRGAGGSIF
jgi:hypothetical protein